VDLAWRLARQLADGRFHSGESLAARFGVTRSTVWNALETLRERGLEIHAVRGKGYRLPMALDWLDEDRIRQALGRALGHVGTIQVVEEADSSNSRLMASPPPPAGQANVCLAEYQTGGRGRRGRRWLAPPGAGVCLSVAWQFSRPPDNLSALGLVAGLAAREALVDIGVRDVLLKWPNDLVVDDEKLGGVLVEMRAEGNGPCLAVIGVGINHRLPAELADQVRRSGGLAPVDLATVSGDEPPSRNDVAAAVISALARRLESVSRQGTGDVPSEWGKADAIAGRQITVVTGELSISGRAAGIDADGALRIAHEDGMMRVTAGDVSVRPKL
jgi:BirA family biotin operon repressor/biotin-[acetyl-CoA-carboxylase] ligase